MTNAAGREAIQALIQSQFESIRWSPGHDADWPRFHRGFLREARLFPARRPASSESPEDFAERLSHARIAGTLNTFSEKGVGCEVFVVGNVAVAVAGREMTENEMTGSAARTTRDVSVFLLVNNPDGWRIAAQAWDVVEDIPAAFEAAGLPIAADWSPQP